MTYALTALLILGLTLILYVISADSDIENFIYDDDLGTIAAVGVGIIFVDMVGWIIYWQLIKT